MCPYQFFMIVNCGNVALILYTGVKGDWEPQLLFKVNRIVGIRVDGVLFGAEDIPPPCGYS
ncbi:MAG: hypothetical protein NPIRA06_13910 [Nitrospirales bacterium]|nr:MAG: hypothetical protein NPIRA06_13910 [Nitrospirales bacterium]